MNALRLACALVLGAFVSGCVGVNTNTTAFPVPVGHDTFTPVAEFGLRPRATLASGALEYRRGIVEGVDVAGRLGTAYAGIGAKWAFIRSRHVALAVAPSASAALFERVSLWLHAPLLVSVRPHPRVVVTLGGGVTGIVGEQRPVDQALQRTVQDSALNGTWLRHEGSVYVLLSPSLALLPGVNVLVPVKGAAERTLDPVVAASLGLVIGTANFF